MEEMRVYVANLGKYNEGELIGDWFLLPVSYEEVKEQIGLNSFYEEYAIHNFELPFNIDEYTSIEEINHMYDLACEMEDRIPAESWNDIQNAFFNSFEEMVEHADDIVCYPNCDDMSDIARFYIEDSGICNEIPSFLENYIDYVSLGRDMELEGNYVETVNGIFEYIN